MTATKTEKKLTEKKPLSRSEKVASDVTNLLRSRAPLLWIVTREEARVEGFLAKAAAAASYPPIFWDVAAGCTNTDGKPAGVGSADIDETLAVIRSRADSGTTRGAWILRDLPVWLGGPGGARTL